VINTNQTLNSFSIFISAVTSKNYAGITNHLNTIFIIISRISTRKDKKIWAMCRHYKSVPPRNREKTKINCSESKSVLEKKILLVSSVQKLACMFRWFAGMYHEFDNEPSDFWYQQTTWRNSRICVWESRLNEAGVFFYENFVSLPFNIAFVWMHISSGRIQNSFCFWPFTTRK